MCSNTNKHSSGVSCSACNAIMFFSSVFCSLSRCIRCLSANPLINFKKLNVSRSVFRNNFGTGDESLASYVLRFKPLLRFSYNLSKAADLIFLLGIALWTLAEGTLLCPQLRIVRPSVRASVRVSVRDTFFLSHAIPYKPCMLGF